MQLKKNLQPQGLVYYLKTPFFGNMATRMKIINADDWCQTAATDGRNFFYNTGIRREVIHKEIRVPLSHTRLVIVFLITLVEQVAGTDNSAIYRRTMLSIRS